MCSRLSSRAFHHGSLVRQSISPPGGLYIEPMRQKAKRERDSGQSHADPRQLAIGQTVGQGETADPGACRVAEAECTLIEGRGEIGRLRCLVDDAHLHWRYQ